MNPHPSEQAERVRDLLQELLAPICTARKIDQVEGLKMGDVARDAWQDFLTENPEIEADAWWYSKEVIGALDSMIVATLGGDAASFETRPAVGSNKLGRVAMEELLGSWLDEWYRQLGTIDPLAAEITLLRIRGFSDRAISEGLETGLRLVIRIVADISAGRLASDNSRGKEVA